MACPPKIVQSIDWLTLVLFSPYSQTDTELVMLIWRLIFVFEKILLGLEFFKQLQPRNTQTGHFTVKNKLVILRWHCFKIYV